MLALTTPSPSSRPTQSNWEDCPILPAPVDSDSVVDSSPLLNPFFDPDICRKRQRESRAHQQAPARTNEYLVPKDGIDGGVNTALQRPYFTFHVSPMILIFPLARRVCWNRQDVIEHVDINLYDKSKRLKDKLDFLEILWGLLDKVVELIQTVRVHITLILDTGSSGFSEFPNTMRPPCTTMPWTIWPALMVLWGVCWMFYTPLSPADERQLELSLQDTEWTLFSEAPFGAPFLTNQGISNDSALEGLNSLPNDIEFNHFLASRESNRALEPFSEQVAPFRSLNEEFSLDFASSTDFLGAGASVEHYLATACADNHSAVPSPTKGLVVAPTTGASTETEQTAPPSQASVTSTRPVQPPQNCDGEIICDHIDCSNKNLTFTNIRDWSKHKNKHERPYKCTVNGCTRTQGFASKGDQIRHERTVHKALYSRFSTKGSTSNETLHFCDEPNCARGPRNENSGFNRRDNLMDHMRRRHGRVLASSRVSVRRTGGVNGATSLDSQSPAVLPLEEHQMSSSVAMPGKQKRTSTQPLDISEEERNTRKKPRQEDRAANVDTQRMLSEDALTREVEKLRKELEKAQNEKDVLIGIIDRLTKGSK